MGDHTLPLQKAALIKRAHRVLIKTVVNFHDREGDVGVRGVLWTGVHLCCHTQFAY